MPPSEGGDVGSIPAKSILMESSLAIAVVGPTASGKSALAVRLARQFGGEIISADSRQVYRGLDIGSGKITKREMRGIPHHLLDVANPKSAFSAAQYQKLADQALKEIGKRGKVPIICGGTGFYIDVLRGKVTLPPVPPNRALRAKLEKLSTEKLGEKLKLLDPKRFKSIDARNRPRLIRAIEIATALGHVPPLELNTKGSPWGSKDYPLITSKDSPCWLNLGIKLEPEELREKINTRLRYRLQHGLIAEVKKLHANGLSWKRLDALGLEYRYIAEFLQKREKFLLLQEQLATAIWHYAKRQMTWFKRDKTIKWVKDYQEAEKQTVAFLKVRPFSVKVEP